MIAILKHIQIEGPGILGDIFAEHGLHTECIELEEGKALPDIKECEGVVILGGPMNVYEEQKFSFLRDEDAFLKKVIQERIPALGICLGAQLLAKACGAVVKRSPVKEIGWYPIKLTPQAKSDLLFSGLDDDLDVFQWHEDTFEIPSSEC
jgi:GMP synthase-like glutamine amidotransferase